MIRSLTIALLLIAPFALAACGGTGDSYSDDFEDEMAYTDDMAYADAPDSPYADAPEGFGQHFGQQVAAPNSVGQAQQVVLMDRGLQMARGTQMVPAGWDLTQDIATDPNTGRPIRMVLDLRGPRGELVRALGVAQYGQMMGTSFEQSWRQLVMRRFQNGLTDVSLGDLRRSEALEGSWPFQRAAQKFSGRGMRMEGLEASLRARRDGQPVEGVVYVVHFAIDQYQAGTLQASVVLSPPGLLVETVRTNLAIQESHEPNPAFEQRMDQINQAVMQRQAAQNQQRMAQSQQLHQQRMASNQAAFDAHQQRMQTLSGIRDQQFQSWQSQQRSSDEMQRRAVNGIHGTADIYNNQTGETTYGVDGGYDAYWTDPSGAVVGTQGYDNPDALRYEQGVDLDDRYDQGDGW